jgi:hypothetical protein
MANKIAVFEHEQDVNGAPMYFLKRSVTKQLIADGYAKKVSSRSIQMFKTPLPKALQLMCSESLPVYAYGVPYIPAKLPPKELPGVFFEPPDGAVNTTHKLILDLAHLGLPGIAEYA